MTKPSNYDILTEPVFRVQGPTGPEQVSLTEILARLLAGEDILEFNDVEMEGWGAWWRFLVRCAAKVLYEEGLGVAEAGAMDSAALAGRIEARLRTLAPGTSWQLWQPDPDLPAFLQPAGAFTKPGKKKTVNDLTVYIGSKNHERKDEPIRSMDPGELAVSLIAHQLQSKFGGSGLYEAPFANGGFMLAPFVGVVLGSGWMETFRHDVHTLLCEIPRIRSEKGLNGEIWATWLEPWVLPQSGKKKGNRPKMVSIPLRKLDPTFVPIARLVRVCEPTAKGEFFEIESMASSCQRVNKLRGKTPHRGDLGDPFVPIVGQFTSKKVKGTKQVTWTRKGQVARSVQTSGFTTREVLLCVFRLPVSGKLGSHETPASVRYAFEAYPEGRRDARIVLHGIVGGQGKTEGTHLREIPLTPQASRFYHDPEPLGYAFKQMHPLVHNASGYLKSAVLQVDGPDKLAKAIQDSFEAAVEQLLLTELFRAAERYVPGEGLPKEVLDEWAATLKKLAMATWNAYEGRLPLRAAGGFRDMVLAQDRLSARLHFLVSRKVA